LQASIELSLRRSPEKRSRSLKRTLGVSSSSTPRPFCLHREGLPSVPPSEASEEPNVGAHSQYYRHKWIRTSFGQGGTTRGDRRSFGSPSDKAPIGTRKGSGFPATRFPSVFVSCGGVVLVCSRANVVGDASYSFLHLFACALPLPLHQDNVAASCDPPKQSLCRMGGHGQRLLAKSNPGGGIGGMGSQVHSLNAPETEAFLKLAPRLAKKLTCPVR
jgi:hypothetical protein